MATSSLCAMALFAVFLGLFVGSVDAQAQLRFFHGATGVPAVDILVDGEPTVSGLKYGEGSAILEVSAGKYNVGVASKGSTKVMLDVGDLTLKDGKIYNAMVTRGVDQEPTAVIAPMNIYTPKNDSSRVTVFHLYSNAPPVKVFVIPRGTRLRDTEDVNPFSFGSIRRFGNVMEGVYTIISTVDDGLAARGTVIFRAGGNRISPGLDIFIPVIQAPQTIPSPIRLIFGTGEEDTPSTLIIDTREDNENGPGDVTPPPELPSAPTDTPAPSDSVAEMPSDGPRESTGSSTEPSAEPSATETGSTEDLSTPTPGPSEAPVAPAPTEEPDEICIGVESTINGKSVLEHAATARLQTHPLNSADALSRVLCTKLGQDRLCATATHIVTFDGQPVYMRELCGGPVTCTEETQKVFNVKTESGIVADYATHNIQLTHSAARSSISNYVSASRMVAFERAAQRYARPAWRLLTQ